MLKIYTSTFCRPDLIELLANALKITVEENYEFIVHVHKDGLVREWNNVNDIIMGNKQGYHAWQEIIPYTKGHKTIILHEDLIPVSKWNSSIFPMSYCSRKTGGSTLYYGIDGWKSGFTCLKAYRISEKTNRPCPKMWESFCELATKCAVESMCGGIFIHLDKSTIGHPNSIANINKRNLIEKIAQHLNIKAPEPLSEIELSIHPGAINMGLQLIDDPRVDCKSLFPEI